MLHEKAKQGPLSSGDRIEYEQARRELGRFMIIAQQLNHGGKTLRSNLRVAQLMKVELDFGEGKPEKAATIDLASGGFAVLLPWAKPVGAMVPFTLHLPALGASGPKPMTGMARVASARTQGTSFRVSFSFETIDPVGREHLEMVMIDSILARFRPTP